MDGTSEGEARIQRGERRRRAVLQRRRRDEEWARRNAEMARRRRRGGGEAAMHRAIAALAWLPDEEAEDGATAGGAAAVAVGDAAALPDRAEGGKSSHPDPMEGTAEGDERRWWEVLRRRRRELVGRSRRWCCGVLGWRCGGVLERGFRGSDLVWRRRRQGSRKPRAAGGEARQRGKGAGRGRDTAAAGGEARRAGRHGTPAAMAAVVKLVARGSAAPAAGDLQLVVLPHPLMSPAHVPPPSLSAPAVVPPPPLPLRAAARGLAAPPALVRDPHRRPRREVRRAGGGGWCSSEDAAPTGGICFLHVVLFLHFTGVEASFPFSVIFRFEC
ncbi:hypothetical protein ACP70R_043263 [Stipagrostis hirtigluma subsp. patula]